MDKLIFALKQGKICVVDVSQLRGTPALVLSGLILQKIFDHNQAEFTAANPATVPTIAVVEEAQSVLNSSASSGEGPYVAWVKEGRKYDLGAVLITQQPGSITSEILSQGDNWFIFHLLSSGDLQALKKANAHFSDDILSALLNEPIEGNGVYWSSAGGRGYPIPVRILSFEKLYSTRDPEGRVGPGGTFARKIIEDFTAATGVVNDEPSDPAAKGTDGGGDGQQPGQSEPVDLLEKYSSDAIEALRKDAKVFANFHLSGVPWMAVQSFLETSIPGVIDQAERNHIAHSILFRAMNEVIGKDKWKTEKRPRKSGAPGLVTWLVPAK